MKARWKPLKTKAPMTMGMTLQNLAAVEMAIAKTAVGVEQKAKVAQGVGAWQ
jgi:hypothetical protein